MEIIQCSFLKFCLRFGIREVPKECLRILGRTLQERKKNSIYLCMQGKKAVGYGVFRPLPPKYAFPQRGSIIGPYYVLSACRGQGIGSALLKHMLAHAPKDGPVYAYVGIQNKPSIAAFQHNGFEICGYMESCEGKFSISQEKTGFFVLKAERRTDPCKK